MKQDIQKSMMAVVIASGGIHIFCCVLPTLFSIMGLLAGLGVVATLPPSMVAFHDVIHKWEVPMITLSGVILMMAWAAIWYSNKIDCHSGGCAHGACAPKKSRAHLILKIASILFVLNVLIYATVHRSNWFADGVGEQMMHSEHKSHENRHHHH